ncbi:hypothetical protein NLI96_g6402 [Meripilus lineatus]|uniref:Uncharacterized protein n=1 Tax=Meripilus lineatus TaxID=2056292 RepID=A0AAD5V0X8_9APHY|nr:hypothetical protein NLI96_g6402 [Physisporinus lineatus]
MLRLGCKYELEHIWSEAIRRLTRCFPLSFERFQDVVIKGGTCLAPPVQMVPLDAIDIIGVHRELLFDSLIPPVFYSLAQLHSSDVHATYMDKRLSFTELSYYHDTVETLQAFSIKAFSPILTSTVSRLCTQPSECLQAYAEISKHVVRNGLLNSTGIIRDLDALEADIDSDTELRLCEACLQSFRSHHQDICQQMWNGLGECCGVPCWTKAVRKPA